MFLYGLLHLDIPVLVDQQIFSYISSERIPDAVESTYLDWLLSESYDDDGDDDITFSRLVWLRMR